MPPDASQVLRTTDADRPYRRLSVLLLDDDAEAPAQWRATLGAAGLEFSLEVAAANAESRSRLSTGDHDLLIVNQASAAALDGDLGQHPRATILVTPDVDAGDTAAYAPTTVHRVPRSAIGNPGMLAALIRAALAHAEAIAARSEAERRLHAHFESLPNPAYVWRATPDNDFCLIGANEAAHALTHGRIRSRMGDRATAFFSHRPDIVEVMRRCLAGRRSIRREGPYLVQATQEQRYLATTYAFVPPDIVVGHTEDRTDTQRAESAVIDRERQFQALFDSAKDAILIADDEARYVDGNPAALALLGLTLPELRSRRVRDVAGVDGDAVDQAWQQFLRDGFQNGRMLLRRSDGALRTADFSATANFTPGRHLSIVRDVTEREELERELQHVQRLDSIGRLAGGIAHDFNNLLTAIIGFSDLLVATFPPDDPRRSDVAEILRAAESAAGLTRQLLAFSRKQVLQPVVLDINDHVANLTSLLRRLLGDAIEIRTVCQPSPLYVTADPTQLEQILLNLAINARDAMRDGGTLEIRIDPIEVTPETSREGLTLRPGPYARLLVSDSGHGMSTETMAHVFEPFFTTKLRTSGTGLGLATAYGIVKQSGGYIWVSSLEGAGTTFELLLPASPAESTHQASRSATTGRGVPCTVLVVDDDRAIRALAARTLTPEGFTVLDAANATEALEIIRTNSVSLLLTDIVMPGMSGIELAAILGRERPAMKVLFMSGYASDAIATDGTLPASSQVLTKPFTPDLLLASVLRATERQPR